MAFRLMQEKVFIEVKNGVCLKLYKVDALEASDKETDDRPDNSRDANSEKDVDSEGKEQALESSEIGASAARNPALEFHADKEVSLWNETLLHEPSSLRQEMTFVWEVRL